MSEKKTNFSPWKLLAALLVVGVLVGILAATGVFAGLFDTTSVVVNEFEAAEPGNEIHSEATKGDTTRYTVTNTGNLPVLVRVKVLVNWVDEAGNPMLYPPENGTYQLKMGTGWTQSQKSEAPDEGYWYYNGILEANAETAPLINQITAEGGKIQLTILSETIQTTPEEAVIEAWGMRYSDGKWTRAN